MRRPRGIDDRSGPMRIAAIVSVSPCSRPICARKALSPRCRSPIGQEQQPKRARNFFCARKPTCSAILRAGRAIPPHACRFVDWRRHDRWPGSVLSPSELQKTGYADAPRQSDTDNRGKHHKFCVVTCVVTPRSLSVSRAVVWCHSRTSKGQRQCVEPA